MIMNLKRKNFVIGAFALLLGSSATASEVEANIKEVASNLTLAKPTAEQVQWQD